MKASNQQAVSQTVIAKRINQWGVSAFALHCVKLGISFEDAYLMIFGRENKVFKGTIHFMHKA